MKAKLIITILICAAFATAHDTWLQTDTAIVRTGDAIDIDLMLGNHGNDHRDFKLAGKANLADAKIEVIDPDGKSIDIKSTFEDMGYTPKEGFWATNFSPDKPGLYLIAQSETSIASYAPERIVRSAKAFFVASRSLDKVPDSFTGFDRVLGHGFELVPLTNPIVPMGPGTMIKVKLLYHGQPLAKERVSFIPRGQTLKENFDPTYDRTTDDSGLASFEPSLAGRYLIAAHHDEPTEAGTGYTKTKYGATLTIIVPAICPCCGE